MIRLVGIISILLSSFVLSAQNYINSYQYWFDDDYSNATTTVLSPEQTLNLQADIDATHLTPGVHIMYIRFKDTNDRWSSPIPQYIYRFADQSFSSPNNKIVEYQYWFDDGFENLVNQPIIASQNYQLLTDIDASALNSGVHIFYIRFLDDRGQWSSPISQFIYKIADSESNLEENEIVSYQYWFDTNNNDAITESVSATGSLLLSTNIDANTLNTGVHIFYIRFLDDRGQWSLPVSQFIYKIADSESNLEENEIVSYQYWFDTNYNDAITESVSATGSLLLSTNIDANTLNSGVHIFYIRFLDNRGQWSLPVSQFIYKIEASHSSENRIIAYRYWFDNDFHNSYETAIVPSQNFFSLQEEVNMTQIWKGEHSISYQFKDSIGQWSSPITDTIEKNSLPIAEFTYTRVEDCDSTIIYFQSLSMDGDNHLWTFGDGEISTDSITSHKYFETGNYLVSLTVTDTTSLADSTTTELIHIIGSTNSSISEVVCDTYTAPSGAVFTESGIHYDTITNYMFCDSIIEIDLTILESTFAELDVHACDSFVAPSGQVYSASGQYIDTITNFAGCDSIINITLDLGTTTYTTLNKEVCGFYVSPAGNPYTATGTYYDTIPNTSSCDSIIEINLIVLESTFAEVSVHACDSFVSPSGNIYYDSGQYIDTIPNFAGCDSIISINLDITKIDNSITINDRSLFANQNDAMYQWLDCNDEMTAIYGATEQEFFPDIDGNYAVSIELNNCEKTSACYEVLGLTVETELVDDVKVYPNPTTGLVKIELPNIKKDIQVSVYDITSKLIQEISSKNTNYVQFTINAPKGVYFIRIFTDCKSYSKIIVIE
ncbi:MAG: PKD domain-containing protein [Bacteroidales bacterium]|nr:PKD domain-containing protein [Bacteroidales bacterium]